MNYRLLSAGVLAATLLGVGGAAAQTVYVERYSPAPAYVEGPAYVAPADSYVVEQRVAPAYPAVTYERRVIAPTVEPRIVRPSVGVTFATDVDAPAACGYDAFGRWICD